MVTRDSPINFRMNDRVKKKKRKRRAIRRPEEGSPPFSRCVRTALDKARNKSRFLNPAAPQDPLLLLLLHFLLSIYRLLINGLRDHGFIVLFDTRKRSEPEKKIQVGKKFGLSFITENDPENDLTCVRNMQRRHSLS